MANTSITTTATTRGGGEGGGRNKGKETKQQQSSNSTATGAGAQITMTAVRKFNGYFRLVSQRDYDDYLKIIELGSFERFLFKSASSSIECRVKATGDGGGRSGAAAAAGAGTGEWKLTHRVPLLFKKQSNTFKIGRPPLDHCTIDGRKAKTVIQLEGRGERVKMVQYESWGGYNLDLLQTIVTNQIVDNGRIWKQTISIKTLRSPAVRVCVRKFERIGR